MHQHTVEKDVINLVRLTTAMRWKAEILIFSVLYSGAFRVESFYLKQMEATQLNIFMASR